MKIIEAFGRSIAQMLLSALAILMAVLMLFSAAFGTLIVTEEPKSWVQHHPISSVAKPPQRNRPEIILEQLSINSGRLETPGQKSTRNPPLRL